MGKSIKSYATFPQSISPRKGREALRPKSPNLSAKNVIRLNRTHSFLNFSSKIFSNLCFVLGPNFKQIKQNLLNLPTYSANYAKFAPIINPFILHYVSGTCPGRELSGIPVNYANSTQFTHKCCESREICAIC